MRDTSSSTAAKPVLSRHIARGTEDIGDALVINFADLLRLRHVTQRLREIEELRLRVC